MFVRDLGGGYKMTPGILLRLRATSRQTIVLEATKTRVTLTGLLYFSHHCKSEGLFSLVLL